MSSFRLKLGRRYKQEQQDYRTGFMRYMWHYLLCAAEGATRRLDISTRAGRARPWGPRHSGRRAGAAPTCGLAEIASQHEVCITLAKASLQKQVTA